MKTIHILAGLLALAAGFLALFAAKGSPLHRASGRVFVAAMLVMTGSAVGMALFLRPLPINVVAGSLTFYLVCTSWLAVRRSVAQARRTLTAFMLGALGMSAYAFALGADALGQARPGYAVPLFMFGLVGLAGVLLDARMLRAGSIAGAARIARHLWRMTFALWIATASFFLGQAKFFPEPVRKSGLLAIPVLLVLGLLLYWLVRVLVRRGRPAMAPTTPR